jgi:RNA polymerase sigma-70 factor (ECF subfamily)
MTDPQPGPVEIEPAVATIAAGSRAVLVDAFRSHRDELFGFLCRATRDDAAAEDLLQETFLRLAREIEAGRTPDQVRAWLFRVAYNLVVSRSRRRATVVEWMRRHGRETATRVVESPESDVIGRERVTALEAALGRLSPDARSALLLSANGFSGEEIASAIGRSHAATRALLTRARIRMRIELQEQPG